MTVYKYTAVDESGHIKKGVLEGESTQAVRQALNGLNLNPLEITLQREKLNFSILKYSSVLQRNKISIATLALLTYQFGILLSIGLPVESALINMAEQSDDTTLKTALLAIRGHIIEGYTLSYGMNEFPHIFPVLYRMTIAAGEKSGQLEKVVNRLAVHLEQQDKIRQKIQQALIYPTLLTIVSTLILFFLLSYAMPKIIAVFLQSGQALPQMTLFLLGLSNVLRAGGIYILLALILGFFIFKKLLKIYKFRYRYHQFLLKIPILGKTINIINSARFLRTFGILFTANVPVLEAMRVAESVVSLHPMQYAIEKAVVQVGEGVSIHDALFQTGYFSKLSMQLIASGEVSGKLGPMLEKTASYQEDNVNRGITTALSLFEPLMIIMMGMIILFIVLAILLPIFQMNQFTG